jgi:hypothetical protein
VLRPGHSVEGMIFGVRNTDEFWQGNSRSKPRASDSESLRPGPPAIGRKGSGSKFQTGGNALPHTLAAIDIRVATDKYQQSSDIAAPPDIESHMP